MASIIEDIGNLTAKLYNSFLFRDMSYILSGLMILSSISITADIYDKIPCLTWIYILIVFISYFVGLINQEAFVLARIFRMYPISCEKNGFINKESNCIIKLIKLTNKDTLTDDSYKFLERIIVIKQYTASIGSASLTSLIVLISGCLFNKIPSLFKNYILLICIFLFLILLTCLFSNWRKASIQQKIIDGL